MTRLEPMDTKRKITIFCIYLIMYYITAIFIMKRGISIWEAVIGASIFTIIYSYYVNKQFKKQKK